MLFSERKGIIDGVNIALAMIVHELNAKGLVSKEALADQMEQAVQEATALAVRRAGGDTRAVQSRVDLLVLQNLAKLLREPAPKAGQQDADAAAQAGLTQGGPE